MSKKINIVIYSLIGVVFILALAYKFLSVKLIVSLTGRNNVTLDSNLSNCGQQGEIINFTESGSPKECCPGLTNIYTSDSISIADKCYSRGTESGAPIISCSNCGNGICEINESICGCLKDCIGKGKSDYQTIQDFCLNGFQIYCDKISKDIQKELELCNLCK